VVKRAQVLLVDDEPNVISGLTRILRKENYELIGAGSGEEALEVLEGKPIDVIVSDEGMPGMSGSALLAEVAKRWPRTSRIMLTGQSDIALAKRAINEGQICRFFTKPASEYDLVFGIRGALELRALAMQSARMLQRFRQQTRLLESVGLDRPGITEVRRDTSGAVVLDPEEFTESVDVLLEQIASELERADAASGGGRGERD
jgi:two-component system, probable response regulator PhcQ